MIDRCILTCLGASALFHLALIPWVSMLTDGNSRVLSMVPIAVVNILPADDIKITDTPLPLPPEPKSTPLKIVAPKLLSKPELFEMKQPRKVEPVKAEPNEPANSAPNLPQVAGKSTDSEVGAGIGKLIEAGDFGAVSAGGSGQPATSLGRDSKRDGSGDAVTSLSTFASPLGAYQVKPRYPEAARRAGAQGTTTLKFRVLANGRVSEITVEQSSGHRDLDNAAVEAVKKWLFEPARMGKEPVASEVIMPVIFQLQK